MNPACQQHRTDLPEGPDGRLDLAGLAARSGHAAECAECAAWTRGVARLGESLYALPRAEAPAELDGLVVATLHAGAREARAVRAVEGLSRVNSPETLAETLDDELGEPLEGPLDAPLETRVDAPTVLERLVREELAEPAKNTVRRVVGGLTRLEAPAELDALVRDELLREPARRDTGRLRFALLRGKHLAWASAAAAVLLLAGPFGFGRRGGTGQDDAPAVRARSFEVVYTRSLQDLDPVARSLVDGVSGGLLTAKGL
jgi:hypothetical protein